MSDLFERVTRRRDPPGKRYLVRFWSVDSRYHEFAKIIKENGLVIQDVLNNFLDWFIQEHKLREAYKNAIDEVTIAGNATKIDPTDFKHPKVTQTNDFDADREKTFEDMFRDDLPKIPKDRPSIPPISPLTIPQPPFNPWRTVPPGELPPVVKCPQCGMKWEGVMGYVCGSSTCPLQPKVTCNSGG